MNFKAIFLLALCCFSFFSHKAEASIVVTPCALNNGIEMAELVENMPIRDKAKHCSVMCVVTNKCSQYSARALGITKELMDIIGPGNAEVADLEANEFGIQLALHNPSITKELCLDQCLYEYQTP